MVHRFLFYGHFYIWKIKRKESFSSELISFYKSTCTYTQAYMHTSLVVSHQTLYSGFQSTHYMTSDFLSDSVSYHSPHASLFRCSNRSSSFLPLNILAFPGNCLPDTLPFRIQLQCHLIKQPPLNTQASPEHPWTPSLPKLSSCCHSHHFTLVYFSS